ncbi:MAG TPA: ATP-binding protein [Gaiellaceae bacterium]|nr:ATP-binding protein [Gaiellaceae bacterium]
MADGFYLGKRLDGGELRLDPGDLTTHAVIVGMTGSGKTGLGIVLLEEALLAGIPALIIDPKGDMGNLALTFPDLSAASFRPWIDESAAQDAGVTPDVYAEQTAARWKQGLADHGIEPARIEALRAAAEVTIYTPGSESGVPLNMIGSLQAPTLSWDTEAEALRDEIEGTVSSLLGLVGVDADPLASREHVLLANLVEHSWRAGQDLDLGTLISQIQSPPLRKLGVFDIDVFLPPKERGELAVRLNALLASPSFAAWGRGPALDPKLLLTAGDGRPRAAVVYLAHLSEPERQFVVTLVLSRVVTWMRGLAGTSDLRALVYFDEISGYAPPTAAPPSKKPILTILKQARAFGVGMVVATQNPIDLDYKAMANAGSWFVGRLQTERDKERVLEGLRSAAGGVDVGKLDKAIGGLEQRQFLLQSAHRDEPELFSTRWAMSFLRGPLTKAEIEKVQPPGSQALEGASVVSTPSPSPLADDESAVPPGVAAGVAVRWLDPAAPWAAQVGADANGSRQRAFLAARVNLRFDDAAAELDTTQEWEALYGPLDEGFELDSETAVDYDDRDLRTEPPARGAYVLPAVPLEDEAFFRDAARAIQRRLADTRTLELLRNRELDLYSRPGETKEAFAARADEAAKAAADAQSAKIRDRLESKRDRLERALETARRRVEEADTEKSSRRSTELISGIGSVVGVLLGGKADTRTIARAGRALGGAATRRGMSTRAAERKQSAEEKVDLAETDLEDLEQELLEEVAQIDESFAAKAEAIETVPIRLESTDVRVVETTLVWVLTA